MHIQAFLDTLPIMGYGMLGIFLVMAVIYALIALLTRSTRNGGDPHAD